VGNATFQNSNETLAMKAAETAAPTVARAANGYAAHSNWQT